MEGTSEDEDVHPIELTVQSLLETPLETLNLNLKSLYESQMILHTILYKMERTLIETANNLRPGSFPLNDQVISKDVTNGFDNDNSNVDSNNEDIDQGEDGIRIDHSDLEGELDLNDYLQRMKRIRHKVKLIEKVINEVESRIGRIESTLDIK